MRRGAHIESAGEELVVSTMNGVAALERDDVDVARQHITDLRRGGARELARRHAEALERATNVVLATLHRNHAHALDTCGRGARKVRHLATMREAARLLCRCLSGRRADGLRAREILTGCSMVPTP